MKRKLIYLNDYLYLQAVKQYTQINNITDDQMQIIDKVDDMLSELLFDNYEIIVFDYHTDIELIDSLKMVRESIESLKVFCKLVDTAKQYLCLTEDIQIIPDPIDITVWLYNHVAFSLSNVLSVEEFGEKVLTNELTPIEGANEGIIFNTTIKEFNDVDIVQINLQNVIHTLSSNALEEDMKPIIHYDNDDHYTEELVDNNVELVDSNSDVNIIPIEDDQILAVDINSKEDIENYNALMDEEDPMEYNNRINDIVNNLIDSTDEYMNTTVVTPVNNETSSVTEEFTYETSNNETSDTIEESVDETSNTIEESVTETSNNTDDNMVETVINDMSPDDISNFISAITSGDPNDKRLISTPVNDTDDKIKPVIVEEEAIELKPVIVDEENEIEVDEEITPSNSINEYPTEMLEDDSVSTTEFNTEEPTATVVEEEPTTPVVKEETKSESSIKEETKPIKKKFRPSFAPGSKIDDSDVEYVEPKPKKRDANAPKPYFKPSFAISTDNSSSSESATPVTPVKTEPVIPTKPNITETVTPVKTEPVAPVKPEIVTPVEHETVESVKPVEPTDSEQDISMPKVVKSTKLDKHATQELKRKRAEEKERAKVIKKSKTEKSSDGNKPEKPTKEKKPGGLFGIFGNKKQVPEVTVLPEVEDNTSNSNNLSNLNTIRRKKLVLYTDEYDYFKKVFADREFEEYYKDYLTQRNNGNINAKLEDILLKANVINSEEYLIFMREYLKKPVLLREELLERSIIFSDYDLKICKELNIVEVESKNTNHSVVIAADDSKSLSYINSVAKNHNDLNILYSMKEYIIERLEKGAE